MFDHVTIRTQDRAASERFFEAVLTPLGIDTTYRTNTFSVWHDFAITVAGDDSPPTLGHTSGSSRPHASRSARSGRRASTRGTSTTGRQARAHGTRPTTTPRSCATPTATASRLSTATVHGAATA
jgi:catechol 2,3-dioxygenase-like lactoylglutathione lyase family enzyme